MKSKYLLYLCVCSLGLMAHKCGNKHNSKHEAETQKTEQAASQEADIHPYYKKVQEKPSDYPDSLILRYERSACFGTCPVDVIEIFKSGYLAYTPFMHGVRDTISSAEIGQDEIDMLMATVDEMGFFDLQDKYDSNIPDLPGSKYFVRKDGKTKFINVVSGTPEEIRPLIRRYGILLKNIPEWNDAK